MLPRKIIVGYQGSDRSRDALRLAAMLSRSVGADLTIAHVHRRGHAGESAALLDEAERLLPYAMRATLCAVEARSPVHGLHDLALSERTDLLVVGATTRSSLELHAVGSVPERLLRAAPCAVAVAPAGFVAERDPGVRVIGVAFDATPEAHEALATASELAQHAGATIKLIGIAEKPAPAVGVASMSMPDPEEHLRDGLLRELEAAADELPPVLRPEVVLVDGDPARELIDRATPLSLLVIGSRGYGPVRRALLGSVSAPVLRAAPCPVLVVPRGRTSTSPEPAAAVAPA